MTIMSIHKGVKVTLILAKRARLAQGWANDVAIEVLDEHIAAIEVGASSGDVRVDTLLPSIANLHSHTFQRAMAGMTEYRAAGRESFWTWRRLMYQFLDRLTPEHVEAIAALVFVEMQEAGYASVGEFHYVHHRTGGARYDDVAELSGRIAAAAETTGIGLTLLPVLYSYGGAQKQVLAGGQLRFGNDVSQYLELVDGARKAVSRLQDGRVGIAPHSLRASSPEDLVALLAAVPAGPVHMHIAEQPAEVEQIEAWLGARPVAWALDNLDVDARWCMIHATHMTQAETLGLARSGAVAGLCPITEANLGDGPFNGPAYLNAGGAFGVGSDSNVRISLTEELRTLEYSQRLRDVERNVMVVGEGSVGETLYLGAAKGGAQAVGRDAGEIRVGALADLVAADSRDVSLCALGNDKLLDGLCFAADDQVVTDVWSGGRHKVQGGRHVAREAVEARYRVAVAQLVADI